jgi:hypothetical protein
MLPSVMIKRLDILLVLSVAPTAVFAGPPFLTDDPEPTETGHWEIYAPQLDWNGRNRDYEGSFGAEINFGAAEDVQLTLGLPVAFAHDAGGSRAGADDVSISVKYRFYQDEEAGTQVAFFPGVTLPTGSNGFGADRMTALLPVWFQKDAQAWLLFGGGGYAINPGPGNRDYWTGAANVSRRFGERWLVGAEAQRQGADTNGGTASTSFAIGAICRLAKSFRLLGRVGPTFDDAGGPASFHAFLALGLDF